MGYRIPVYKPSLAGNEKKYVNDCIDSTWISSKGDYIARFENAFANLTEVNYAASVCNGTVALHVALVALGLGPGDEVIVPTLTYIASVNAIKYTGATPVFVDSLEDSWQIDPEDVKRKFTKNTKAIMAVHLYGHPCDMTTLKKLGEELGVFIIEDCAEAIGSRFEDKHVGGFGIVSAYSFFGNKTITTGEGGMVVTNNKTLHERVVHLKGQGLAKHREYWHDVIGYNYRMTNVCAAIGLAQIERAEEFINKKREIADQYKNRLSGLPLSLHKESSNVKHSYWMCSIILDDAEQRDLLRKALYSDGIETRPVFYPVHTMPIYSSKFESHPVAENIARRGINLPSWPDLSNSEIQLVCESISNFFNNINDNKP